jgi:hypothetical protein
MHAKNMNQELAKKVLADTIASLGLPPSITMTQKYQRAITRDWAELVPDMKKVNSIPMRLHKRIGPMLISLCLRKNKYATIYEPYLNCFSLCHSAEGLPVCFELSSYGEYKGKPTGGMITSYTHEDSYQSAFKTLESKATFQLKQDLTVEEVVMAYRDYILNQKYICREMYDQALIPAWAGDEKLAQDSLEWAKKHKDKVWKTTAHGVFNLQDYDWLSDLEKRISNPELLRKIVKDEVKKRKLEKLSFHNFIDSPYQESAIPQQFQI